MPAGLCDLRQPVKIGLISGPDRPSLAKALSTLVEYPISPPSPANSFSRAKRGKEKPEGGEVYDSTSELVPSTGVAALTALGLIAHLRPAIRSDPRSRLTQVSPEAMRIVDQDGRGRWMSAGYEEIQHNRRTGNCRRRRAAKAVTRPLGNLAASSSIISHVPARRGLRRGRRSVPQVQAAESAAI